MRKTFQIKATSAYVDVWNINKTLINSYAEFSIYDAAR